MTVFHTIVLLQNDKENKLIDGFLAGRDRVQQEVERAEGQGRLL